MGDEWEKGVNSSPKAVVANKWDDEDEDDDIKDNWDDEEEDRSEPSAPSSQSVPNVSKLNANKKKMLKIAEKERKEQERLNARPKTTEEVLAEKLERQRLQEEADLLLAKEAFGEESASKSGSGLDISLNTKEDFDSFRKSLVEKLILYDKSPHFVNFLENLFRELCVSIESDDIKRLSSSLTALFNEKVKAQKVGTNKKKKGKGVSVRVERNDDFGVGVNDNFEEFDDFI